MSAERRRLDRIESSLSPTQAVCPWLTEAHQHGSLFAYTQWLLDQPDDSYPLVKMPGQVVEAVRTAMKGKPRAEIDREIYLAQRDVLVLFHLAIGLNARALELAETLRLKALLLGEQFHSLLLHKAIGRDTNDLRFRLCRELPYPLDPETAAAVEAAQKHGVLTWELRLAPVDVARIVETADGSGTARYLIDVAKAEALEKLGERGKAEAILEPHLRGTP